MGKKKGRQSNGFGSKARRAAFTTEWQSLAASEVPLLSSSRRGTKKQAMLQQQVVVAKSEQGQERPKQLRLNLNHLQHMLQERLHHDRMEDAAQRQRHHKKKHKMLEPTSLTSRSFIYDDEDDSYREAGLALICVKALAPVLQDYICSIGKERIHHYLSLLPDKTLTALSVELSTRQLWKSDDMVYVVSHHPHISRLAIWLPPPQLLVPNSKTMPSSSISSIDKMLVLQPKRRRFVPECWEDEDDACCLVQDYDDDGSIRRRLARLELRNMPLLQSETVQSLLSSVTTSHLSLSGSMDWIEGPHFMEHLSNASTTTTTSSLKVLDVSHCSWMISRLLLQFRHKHHGNNNVRLIHDDGLEEESSTL